MKDVFEIFGVIFIGIAILGLLMLGSNSCTADKWNNGICTDCNIKYELCGVSNAMKYYSCPNCGQEVGRY